MSPETPFCPDYCLWKNSEMQEKIVTGETYDICSLDCQHKDDVVDTPYNIVIFQNGREQTETVIGHNGDYLYLESGGQLNSNNPNIIK